MLHLKRHILQFKSNWKQPLGFTIACNRLSILLEMSDYSVNIQQLLKFSKQQWKWSTELMVLARNSLISWVLQWTNGGICLTICIRFWLGSSRAPCVADLAALCCVDRAGVWNHPPIPQWWLCRAPQSTRLHCRDLNVSTPFETQQMNHTWKMPGLFVFLFYFIVFKGEMMDLPLPFLICWAG